MPATARPSIAADEARPCRGADAADRAGDEGREIAFAALDRIAVTTGPGSFTGLARRIVSRARHRACRRQAGRRRDHSVRLCRARRQRGRRASGDLGDRCPTRPRLFPGCRRRRQFAGLAAARSDRRGARRLAVRRAAPGRQCREILGRALAGRRAAAVQGRSASSARHRLGGLAGRRRQSGQCAAPPYYLRAPDAKPAGSPLQKARSPPPTMMRWLSDGWPAARAVVEAATSRDARAARAAARRIVSPRLGRRRIRDHARRAQYAGASPAIAAVKSSDLRSRGSAADEAEILSIAVAAHYRGRGLSRDLLLTHLGHLAGRGVRTVFLEVEENNAPARRLYQRAGFASPDAASDITSRQAGNN